MLSKTRKTVILPVLALVAACGVALAVLISAKAQTENECAQFPAYCADKINRADEILHDTSVNRRQRILDAQSVLEEPVPTATTATTETTITDTTTTNPTTTITPPPSGQQISVFDLGWAPSDNIPWNDLTQIYLFNLATSSTAALDRSNISNIDVPQWVDTAHSHGVKAIISIGGSDDNNWGNSCGTTFRAQFVLNLVNFATSNNFDGIDLDIEDGPWSNQNPPVQAMTNCIQAVSLAAHAAGLFVAGDVITPWQGPWWTDAKDSIDQFNLMTYYGNFSSVQGDVQDTISAGLPESKFTIGADTNDFPNIDCSQYKNYSSSNGMAGTFVWEAESEARHNNACLDVLHG